MNVKQVEVMATYILKTVLSDIGDSLEQDSRNETQTSVSSAMYRVAHQLQSYDSDWHISELCKAVSAVRFDGSMPSTNEVEFHAFRPGLEGEAEKTYCEMDDYRLTGYCVFVRQADNELDHEHELEFTGAQHDEADAYADTLRELLQ